MLDKYGVKLEEGNQVIVSASDKEQDQYFGKYSVLEIKYCKYLKKFLALVDYRDGDWVSSKEVIYLQGA